MKNKVVIITGASSGIGKALAHELGKAGAKLALAARREEALQEIAAEYDDVLVVKTDVTVEAQCRNLIEEVVEKFGKIDVLVNNAGISMQVKFDEIQDLMLFHKIMDVNYFGMVYCTHFALPHLKKSKGLIVGISSMAGKVGVPTRTGYAASKHAMQGFLDSLRIELMGTGVDVSVISPGFVQSEVRLNALGADAKSTGTSRIDESSIMSSEECARQIHDAIVNRKRDVIIAESFRSKIAPLLKLLFPKMIDNVTRKGMETGTT